LSDSIFSKARFSLKSLLIAMVVVAAMCWFVDRYISDRAHFKILETDLHVEGEYVSGAISFRCSRWDENGSIQFSNAVLYVRELSGTRLADLKVADEFYVRYRYRDFGPIAKQDRRVIFLVRELGLPKEEETRKWVHMEEWTEIYVSRMSEESP
jgi:hypothetical protein